MKTVNGHLKLWQVRNEGDLFILGFILFFFFVLKTVAV